MEAFDPDREEVLARARAAGIECILTLAMIDENDSYRRAFPLVEAQADLVTAVGCHPHDAKIFDERGGEDLLRSLASRPRVVGIGEIGLDYHYNLSPPSVQRDVFRRQIRVARALSLPVVVHHREAESDLLKVLEEEKVNEVRGILHSFTADRKTAESALEMGFLVSFSGILTFKNASPLREVARSLPLNRILVESDCPYLAPVPHRGKRNEPALVRETLLCLAELKGLPPEEVERATDDNFRRFFGLT
jgi:TatD DNase family protein